LLYIESVYHLHNFLLPFVSHLMCFGKRNLSHRHASGACDMVTFIAAPVGLDVLVFFGLFCDTIKLVYLQDQITLG